MPFLLRYLQHQLLRLALVLLLIVSPSVTIAVGEYFSLSRSFRALGMGGAYYGLSNDEYAMFYNPAGVSLYDRDWELMLTVGTQISKGGINNVRELIDTIDKSDDIDFIVEGIQNQAGEPLHANVTLLPYYIRKHFAVGLLLADAKANVNVLGREFDTAIELALLSDSGLFITYGQDVGIDENRVHLGITTKFLYRAGGKRNFSVLDFAQGNNIEVSPRSLGGVGGGIDFDIGALYQLRPLLWLPAVKDAYVGLTITNLLASGLGIGQVGDNAPGLSRKLSLGSKFVFDGFWIFDHIVFVFDLADFFLGGEDDPDLGAPRGSKWKHVNWGFEFPIGGWLAIRTGFRQGNFSAGIGLNLSYVELEFVTYAEELGQGVGRFTGRRYGLRLALGLGEPNQPAVPLEKKKIKKAPKKKPKKTLLPPKMKVPSAPKKVPPVQTPPKKPDQPNNRRPAPPPLPTPPNTLQSPNEKPLPSYRPPIDEPLRSPQTIEPPSKPEPAVEKSLEDLGFEEEIELKIENP